jgi:hypothetical protein
LTCGRESGFSMELDFYSEKYNMALEYQGDHHYFDKFKKTPLEYQSKRDLEKTERCKRLNISLITVPYWWSGDEMQLIATIHKERPDVLYDIDTSGNFIPIALNLLHSGVKPISSIIPKPNTRSSYYYYPEIYIIL